MLQSDNLQYYQVLCNLFIVEVNFLQALMSLEYWETLE